MKKLSVDFSNFERIRREDYIYVDKTRFIHQIATRGTYYFLSRPRRFGKSLLISTLKALFEGKRELFEGLWIAEHGNWEWQKHAVIALDFNEIAHDTPENLEIGLKIALSQMAKAAGIVLETPLASSKFQELILALYQQSGLPVAVLIDEYDKPMIDHLGQGEERLKIAKANRDMLKSFFGVLKGITVSPALCFVLLTGVSKFSKVSIFSELNNLQDLTMDEEYADFLGYTQEELESCFEEHLAQFAQKLNCTVVELVQELAYHYNGYRFSRREVKVYNPFSVMNALKRQNFDNYWFESGTPTFLVNLLKQEQYNFPSLENFEAAPSVFTTYEIDNLNVEAILFQTGYATIKEFDENIYLLGYPNREVKSSFTESLLFSVSESIKRHASSQVLRLAHYLRDGKLELFFETVQAIFATIPYDIQAKRDEAYYHALFYLMISASGSHAQSSLLTCRGRIDMVVEFRDRVYILEFKCNQNAAMALQQIETKGYADRYKQDRRKLILLGLNFSTAERNLVEWQVKP